MNDKNWIAEYKEWRSDLKPYQIELLENGAESASQQWLINSMWCEWKEIKKIRVVNPSVASVKLSPDPWEDEELCG